MLVATLPPLYFCPRLNSLYHHGSTLLSFSKINAHGYSEGRAKTTDFLQASSRVVVLRMFNTAVESVEWISLTRQEPKSKELMLN